ncbi:hypothetical protein FOA52_005650 [Chlamydomonas sp. UWO 241]|nr:hypothetical protein FOA52_005650 [Chlamydomonas sp. UWO 241]
MALRSAATSLFRGLTSAGGAESVGFGSLLPAAARANEALFSQHGSVESVREASNQAVKLRIRAIKNIGKITKAMKFVAASKMRSAQVAVENSRGIVDPFTRLFGDHPCVPVSKDLILAVTSDKGLCGGLNSSITKYTRQLIKITAGDEGSPSEQIILSIGDKGRSQLTRAEPEKFKYCFNETFKVKVTFAQSSMIAEELLKYNPGAVRVLFNKFGSAISYKPTVSTVMSPETIEQQMNEPSGNKLDAYEIESTHERADTLADLAEFQLAATLYNAMLENNCSESASRMAAMENSTKSAGEMLSTLTLSYNRKRQSTITTELIEIIAGASALMDAA